MELRLTEAKRLQAQAAKHAHQAQQDRDAAELVQRTDPDSAELLLTLSMLNQRNAAGYSKRARTLVLGA